MHLYMWCSTRNLGYRPGCCFREWELSVLWGTGKWGEVERRGRRWEGSRAVEPTRPINILTQLSKTKAIRQAIGRLKRRIPSGIPVIGIPSSLTTSYSCRPLCGRMFSCTDTTVQIMAGVRGSADQLTSCRPNERSCTQLLLLAYQRRPFYL